MSAVPVLDIVTLRVNDPAVKLEPVGTTVTGLVVVVKTCVTGSSPCILAPAVLLVKVHL